MRFRTSRADLEIPSRRDWPKVELSCMRIGQCSPCFRDVQTNGRCSSPEIEEKRTVNNAPLWASLNGQSPPESRTHPGRRQLHTRRDDTELGSSGTFTVRDECRKAIEPASGSSMIQQVGERLPPLAPAIDRDVLVFDVVRPGAPSCGRKHCTVGNGAEGKKNLLRSARS